MDSSTIEAIIRDPSNFESWIAKLMNNTIALVDSDPSLDPRGKEARVVENPGAPAVALVHNSFEHHHTLVVVNTSGKSQSAKARLSDFGLDFYKELFDNISARTIPHPQKDDHITLEIQPYGRLWIKNARVEIKPEIQVEVGSDDDMKAALITQNEFTRQVILSKGVASFTVAEPSGRNGWTGRHHLDDLFQRFNLLS